MQLRGLGYVGVEAPDPMGWLEFGTEVCGLAPARSTPGGTRGAIGEDGSVFLKMDDRRWRVAVHPAEAPGIAYLGFELAGLSEIDEAINELRDRGVAVRSGSAEEAVLRGVGALAVLEDPTGNRIELFAIPVRDGGFASPHGGEFLTGDLGMGHVNLYVPDMEAALDFYVGILNFKRSDFIRFGPGLSAQFLRCTPRHHSVALLHVGDISGLQHLMVEVTSIDDVGRALDRAVERGVPITSSLGRHKNDGVYSFYMRGPSGFDLEIGWDGVRVGADWIENEFADGDLWGHHGLTPEALEAAGS